MENEKIGIGQYLKEALKQSLQLFKRPWKLLPTLAIGIVWVVVGILSSTRTLSLPVKVISFLSYAEGGLFGGVLGAMGGIIGKVMVAVFINSLVLPLFEKKPPFAGMGKGIKGMFTCLAKDTTSSVAPLFLGIGLALLLYTFMNINQCRENSMVGIAAVMMLLKNIGSKGGFIFGLLSVMLNKRSAFPRTTSVLRFLSGMTMGFTFAVVLTFIGLRWCFWICGPFLVVGLIIGLIARARHARLQRSLA